MFLTAMLSLGLLAAAGTMIDSQLRRRREQAEIPGVSEQQQRYFRSQFRRRMQANVLIALVGVLVAIWPLVPRDPQHPWWMITYGATILIATFWIVLMAIFDAWATSHHYRRVRLQQIAQQAQAALEAQRKKLEAKGPAEED